MENFTQIFRSLANNEYSDETQDEISEISIATTAEKEKNEPFTDLRVIENDRLAEAEEKGYIHIFIDEILMSMVNEMKLSTKKSKFSLQLKKFATKKILTKYPGLKDSFEEVTKFQGC